MTRRRSGGGPGRWGYLLGALVVVAAVVGGVVWWLGSRPVPDEPTVVVRDLVVAWNAGRLATATFDAPPSDLAERITALTGDLGDRDPTVTITEVSLPVVDEEAGLATATADLAVTWVLADGLDWSYDTEVSLVRPLDQLTWSARWDVALVHPDLEAGWAFALERTRPERGDVLGADGTLLVTDRPVVDVGVEPVRIEDQAQLIADLAVPLRDVLDVDIDVESLATRLSAATPNAFVDVVTLRDEDYQQVRDAIQPLPGTVFRERRIPLAPTSEFASFTLGSAGPVTAEMIDEQPDRYLVGDTAGRSGLQEAYDSQLFGEPGLRVVFTGDGAPDEVLFSQPPRAGTDVVITLDEQVQRAADLAVSGTGFATAMAVVRPSDGAVLALANSSESTFDIARTGQLPPGSVFKIITTEALFAAGVVTPDDPIACPNEITIRGRTITNAETQDLGTVPFATAFANSCNTAFVALSQSLSSTALTDAAARFGIGGVLELGMAASAGDVPETGDDVDLAASAIGQGRILVSPLAMAGAVAAVANPARPALSLVVEPAPDGVGDVGAVPPTDAAILQDLTRQVVLRGTATSMADAPGGEVHGKTGTAEFSADGELRTHAWFVGYQGDLAFAVAVTDTPGRYGGDVAAPVAERFLELLAET